jgi:hypothetical protein
MANYDYTDQGAFPYHINYADKNKTSGDPNYNAPGSYDRQVVNGHCNLN